MRVEGDTLVELDARDVGAAAARRRLGAMLEVWPPAQQYAVDDADFAPVVLDPGKIICLGLNYEDHILEMGRELPRTPPCSRSTPKH